MFNHKEYTQILEQLSAEVCLVAVSKFHPPQAIEEAYSAGQRHFGESRPQELVQKYEFLPKDILWHQIGPLQRNKIKYIAPFVALIHSVDSLRLAEAINAEGEKIGRKIPILLQIHVAQEDTKQGFLPTELLDLFESGGFSNLNHLEIQGLMTMATYTPDQKQIAQEFSQAKSLFDTLKSTHLPNIVTLSMGMSGDYQTAIEQGATMLRIGSTLFGSRV